MNIAKKKTRISLDLSQAAFDRLSALEAVTEFDNKADLIRDALRLYEYLVGQSLKGWKVQCVSPNGDVETMFISSLPTPVNDESTVSA